MANEKFSFILDGLLGTGFRSPLSGLYAELIQEMNRLPFPCFSVDIPSGLNGNGMTTGLDETFSGQGAVVNAEETFFLEYPKIGFFLNHAWNSVGRLSRVSFGLESFIEAPPQAQAYLLEEASVGDLLPPLVHDRHKHQVGSVVIWAGSEGMEGSCALASHAALRSGCGLLRACIERSSRAAFKLPVEAMQCLSTEADLNPKDLGIQNWLVAMKSADACLIGPGVGKSQRAEEVFLACLNSLSCPTVLDADALHLFSKLGPKTTCPIVMTPHVGELKALLGINGPFVFNRKMEAKCQAFCEERDLTLILKGAPSYIFHPQEKMRIMPRGHPGMATAGSGDVLAGIVTSLLAQGLTPLNAVSAGAYVHGLAGELAAKELTGRSLMASDLCEYLPAALKQVEGAGAEKVVAQFLR